MEEVLREFVTEALDSVESVDQELVRFEQEPTNAATLANIFRLVHTVKGTCGFLDLPRLEALSHAAESLIGQFRDGAVVTSDAVTLIPRLMLRGDIDRGIVAAVPLPLDLPPRPAGIIRLPDRPTTPGVEAVIACLREVVRGLDG